MSTAMIAITTSSSISVKPVRHRLPCRPRFLGMRLLPVRGTVIRSLAGVSRPRDRGHLPDLHGPVRAGRGDLCAVAVERHALHPAGVAAEGADFAAGLVPDLDGGVGPPPGH